MCPLVQEENAEQVNMAGHAPAPRKQYDPYSSIYNPGWKDHPNFSYGGNRQPNFAPNRQQGHQQQYQSRPPPPPSNSSPSLEKMMKQSIANQQKTDSNLQSQRKLPSQPELNPKNVSAVTLRSGKEVQGPEPVIPKDKDEKKIENEFEKEGSNGKNLVELFETVGRDELEVTLIKHLEMETTPEVEWSEDLKCTIGALRSLPTTTKMYKVSPIFIPEPHQRVLPSVAQAPELELKPLLKHLKYAYLGDNETLMVIISAALSETHEEKLIRVLKEHKEAIGWTITDIKGISPSICMYRIRLEEDGKPVQQGQRRLNPLMMEVVKKEILKLLDVEIIFTISDSPWIAIAPEDQEKMTFMCLFGTFAYRRMPFGLCNASATFQRCMVSIFSEYVEKIIEVFMDDFSMYGDSFDTCLDNLKLILLRCIETNLVLNWEKCHFMVKHGIVLGHVVSSKGIEIDKDKIDIISALSYPTSVQKVRSFLGHAGFYRRFIKDFSKIEVSLFQLLQKKVALEFDDNYDKIFDKLKELLISPPIIQPPDWSLPFKIMCDTSDHEVEAVLGQRVEKAAHVIYYASQALNEVQLNYFTIEKDLLAVIFTLENVKIPNDQERCKIETHKVDTAPARIRPGDKE
nr:uncharacterized protein LOC113718436 [Coffea arabica]